LRPCAALFRGLENRAGNIETGDVYLDRTAPIITREDAGHVLRSARWGRGTLQERLDQGLNEALFAGSGARIAQAAACLIVIPAPAI
jgi:hypothetical protein